MSGEVVFGAGIGDRWVWGTAVAILGYVWGDVDLLLGFSK